MKHAFEHSVDSKTNLTPTWYDFWLRVRGICVAIIISLLGGGWISYLQWFQKDDNPIDYKIFSLVVYVVLAFLVIGLIVKIRKLTIRSIKLAFSMHSITHELRDIVSDAENKIRQKSKNMTFEDADNYLRNDFGKQVSQLVKEYFSVLTGRNVDCALRMINVIQKDDDKNAVEYFTIARTNGFNSNRTNNFGLPINKGVPKFFASIENAYCTGVLIYHDLLEAKKQGAYFETPNDQDFPNDVTGMMVAPVNGWLADKTVMIGLLHVTSTEDIFDKCYTDSMCSISDSIGLGLSRLIQLLHKKRKILIQKGSK